jgi:hypothetical protein
MGPDDVRASRSSRIVGSWRRERLARPLADVRHRQGKLIGHMEALGFSIRQEAVLETLTVLDATRNFDQPLTNERLFAWHASLFPTGGSGLSKIRVGAWREDSSGPMQVVSGPIGRERVHFVAPADAGTRPSS